MGTLATRCAAGLIGLASTLDAGAAWPALGPAQRITLPLPDAYRVETRALAVADLDSDGNADVVVQAGISLAGMPGQPYMTRLFVLLGRGDGTFDATVMATLPGRTVTTEMQIRDVDQDGALDVLFAVYEIPQPYTSPASTKFAKGNGDGTFAVPIAAGFADGTDRIGRFGDLNGDGRDDLLLHQSGSVLTQLGSATGFVPHRTLYTGVTSCVFAPGAHTCDFVGTAPRDSRFGDLDGDGDLDVLVQAQQLTPREVPEQILRLHRNAGLGALEPPLAVPLGMSAFDWQVPDLDHDGDDDLVALGRGTLLVDLDPLAVAAGEQRRAVRGGDLLLSHDRGAAGWSFVIFTESRQHPWPDWVQVVNRAADATLTTGPARPVGSDGESPTQARLADFDQDGRTDYITIDRFDAELVWRQGIEIVLNMPPPAPASGLITLSVPDDQGVAGRLADYVAIADPDGDSIGFELVAAPTRTRWFTFDPVEGEFEYYPDLGTRGDDAFTVKATDGVDTSTTFTVRLRDARPPVPPPPPPPSNDGGGGGPIDAAALVALLLLGVARYFCAAIQRSIFRSSTSSGSGPSASNASWNARMSNLAPSAFSALARICLNLSSPIL